MLGEVSPGVLDLRKFVSVVKNIGTIIIMLLFC